MDAGDMQGDGAGGFIGGERTVERVVGMGLACDLVDAFIDAEFEGGKHQRRVDMITAIESEEANA